MKDIIVVTSTFITTLVTCLFTCNKTLAILSTKIDMLSERVEKHNTVIERTYRLEGDVDIIKNKLDL